MLVDFKSLLFELIRCLMLVPDAENRAKVWNRAADS